MLTPAHRRILETLADPERRAGLRRDERDAVRAALESLERAVSACVVAAEYHLDREGRVVWGSGVETEAIVACVWVVGDRAGIAPTRASAEAAVRRAMGWEVLSP
jgi:arginyl-tRNA--protein-N-Asp/Glu arginylyltransferase